MHFSSTLASLTALIGMVALTNGLEVLSRTEDCTPFKRGYLAANVTGVFTSFTVNSDDSISYIGNKQNPLRIEFQKCATLQDQGPGKLIDTNGRVYVPSKGKCIAISNVNDPTGPYFTTLLPCDTTPPFRFLIRNDIEAKGGMYWYGITDEEGTDPQGGCGLLGYKANSLGIPVVTQKTRAISVTCDGYPGHPFQIAKKPH